MKFYRSIFTGLVCLSLLLTLPSAVFASSNKVTVDGEQVGLITHSEKKETGDEVFLIRKNYSGDYEDFRRNMRKDASPNTVQNIYTFSAKDVTSLTVSASYFGVIVEPQDTDHIVIDLIGVKYPKQVTVDAGIVGDQLMVTVTGNRNDSRLVSTVAEDRINIVRIGVPASILQKIQLIDNGDSCILINNLDIPVNATIGSGTARVQKEKITSAITMECSSGEIIVKANRVEGALNLTTSSGDAVLIADTVTGKTALTATSGDVKVDVNTLHDAVLAVTSGDIKMDVKTLHQAVLTATSGDIKAKVSQIVTSVKATVRSGDLKFQLSKSPTNIRFVLDGKENSADMDLPKGWYNGYTIGNGKPILHLGVGSGELELEID